MECDNNNDFDIASVKALDNKLCSEVCLPGEWQSADMNLAGDIRHPKPWSHPVHLSPPLQCLPARPGCSEVLVTAAEQ